MVSYFTGYYMLYNYNTYLELGDKNNNFLKQFKKECIIPKFLFSLHQFFEIRSTGFSFKVSLQNAFHGERSGSRTC